MGGERIEIDPNGMPNPRVFCFVHADLIVLLQFCDFCVDGSASRETAMVSRRIESTGVGGLGGFKFLVLSMALLVVLGASQKLAAADRPRPGTEKSKSEGRAGFIDRLLEGSWKKAGVNPAKPATDEEYLRRAYLDLLGRIPDVQEARAFLQTKETDKREKLVDFLLEHADYPKNFATQWTILLIGRANQGQIVDRGALSSWLRKQFAANRPWNDVVFDLVTAAGSNKQNGAVNYILAHLEFDAVPLSSRTTRLFLGQQIQCTQCHDHPSNEWKQGDFWRLLTDLHQIITRLDVMLVWLGVAPCRVCRVLSDRPLVPLGVPSRSRRRRVSGPRTGPASFDAATCTAPSPRSETYGWSAPHDCWSVLAG